MASSVLFISASVAVLVISLLFLIAYIQNAVDEKSILATPTIPIQDGVLTTFASTQIRGTVDEVFTVVLKYSDYHKWSPYAEYKWKDVTADGVPIVGSTGTFKLYVEDFAQRITGVRLTLLDRERRRVAEQTIRFPKWLLGSERVQEVVPVEGRKNLCEYRTWITLQGVGAYYLLFNAQDELAATSKKCVDNLKSLIERKR